MEDGSVIPPYYDSLIAKLIVRDETRDLCIARARRALSEFDIRGVPTTRDAAFEILGSDQFASGAYSTSFIDEAGAKLPALAGA
jgi:acetyl-CoA carboxylase biotin carboxylase subunit